jgi:LacI family transcriptional regulator
MKRGAKASPSVTIKDVARAAGVSIATVSRSLNSPAIVERATRDRVQSVVRSMGYVPHGAAQSLIKRRTNTVAVVLPDIAGDFFSELIHGIDGAARQAGYHVLVSSAHNDAREVDDLLRTLNGRVDGMIAMAPDAASLDSFAQRPSRMPVVLLRGPFRGWTGSALGADNYGGACALMRHLLLSGHRRIAFLSGPTGNYDAEERLRAYRDEMRAAKLTKYASVIAGDFGEDSGCVCADQIIAESPRATALFCANDAMALGALSRLQECGIKIPADIALAGYDDVRLARFTTPALTTVRVPIAELGRRALTLVLDEIRTPNTEPVHLTLPTELIIRNSSR